MNSLVMEALDLYNTIVVPMSLTRKLYGIKKNGKYVYESDYRFKKRIIQRLREVKATLNDES